MTSASAEYSFARTSGSRIQSLDGLRCLSILLVMAFHYYSRWTPPENAINHYPYGDAFAYWPPAQWGFLGVQLFFVISGFVIALTLSRCHSIVQFAVRRLARLWPTMFLCSVLTLVTLKLLPESPFAVSALNFVPSWLFTDPAIFNALTGERTFGWMDGAYWSLFVEVRFYVLVAALYFADRSRFTRNLTLAGGLIAVAYAICKYIAPGAPETVLRWVFIAHDLPWFLIGAGMYLVNSERKHSYWLIAVGLAALLCNATIAGQLHLLSPPSSCRLWRGARFACRVSADSFRCARSPRSARHRIACTSCISISVSRSSVGWHRSPRNRNSSPWQALPLWQPYHDVRVADPQVLGVAMECLDRARPRIATSQECGPALLRRES